MSLPNQDDFTNIILFFCPKSMPKVYQQIFATHQREGKSEFGEINATQDSEELVVTQEYASVLFCIEDRDDIVQLLTLCKMNMEKIRQGVLKIGGLNLTGSHKLDDVLKKSGVSDVFMDSISSKTLDYKINFWAKGIKTNLKKIRTVVKGNFNFADGKPGNTAARELSEGKDDIIFDVVSALDFTSDCWLRESAPEEPRKVLGHFIIDLIGPSPYAGRWVEMKNEGKQDEDELWEWVPLHEEVFQFVEHSGRWVAKGKQPQFVWKTNSWKFMGVAPCLLFAQEKGENVVRFQVTGNTLTIAEDSKYAKAKRQLIEESFDPKIIQKKDSDNSKETLEDEDELLRSAESVGAGIEGTPSDELNLKLHKTADKLDSMKGKASAEEDSEESYYKSKLKKKNLEEKADQKNKSERKDLGGFLRGKIKSHEAEDEAITGPPKDEEESLSPLARKLQKRREEEEAKKKERLQLKKIQTQTGNQGPEEKEEGTESQFVKTQNLESSQAKKKDYLSTKRMDKGSSSEQGEDKGERLSELAQSIKKRRKEENQKKKEASGIKTLGAVPGMISGKFKTLKEKEEEKKKREALRSEKDHKAIDWSSTDLELESDDEDQKQGRSERERKKSPFGKHSGIADPKEKELLGKMGVAPVKTGDISGKAKTEKLEEDPLAGSQEGTDELEKFLQGKTAWKEELGGHLRLTKLAIQLTMSVSGSNKMELVTLSDVVDNILVLNVPREVYSYGQKAKIDVLCSYGSMDLNFSVSGSIVDIYESNEEMDCCNIELDQYNENHLKQLKKLFGDRQKNITNFFLQSKGIA